MFKRKIFPLLIIFLFTNSLVFAKMMESKKPLAPPKWQRQEKIKRRVRDLSIKLNLTEEQQKKITEILNKSREDIAKILEETSDKIYQIKMQVEQDIEGVLTEEQRKKFNKIQEKEEEDESVLKIFKGY